MFTPLEAERTEVDVHVMLRFHASPAGRSSLRTQRTADRTDTSLLPDTTCKVIRIERFTEACKTKDPWRIETFQKRNILQTSCASKIARRFVPHTQMCLVRRHAPFDKVYAIILMC
mmetsp:Transcript_31029/g.96012  ORF Transcript_31029/g.96012 Transcript_31029/m.96012 type:complete len:116 (-) Transcript_31029:2522-2869(-)